MRSEGKALAAQVVGFFNKYENLSGRDTLATGGAGTGVLFNGGEARIAGLEASADYDFREVLGLDFSVPTRFSYTFTDAEFKNSFVSGFEPWGAVTAGDKLPYLSPHQWLVGVGLARTRWAVDLESSYAGAMRTSAGRGPIPDRAGTDSFLTVHLSGECGLSEGTKLVLGVQNLTNEQYVVARRSRCPARPPAHRDRRLAI